MPSCRCGGPACPEGVPRPANPARPRPGCYPCVRGNAAVGRRDGRQAPLRPLPARPSEIYARPDRINPVKALKPETAVSEGRVKLHVFSPSGRRVGPWWDGRTSTGWTLTPDTARVPDTTLAIPAPATTSGASGWQPNCPSMRPSGSRTTNLTDHIGTGGRHHGDGSSRTVTSPVPDTRLHRQPASARPAQVCPAVMLLGFSMECPNRPSGCRRDAFYRPCPACPSS